MLIYGKAIQGDVSHWKVDFSFRGIGLTGPNHHHIGVTALVSNISEDIFRFKISFKQSCCLKNKEEKVIYFLYDFV